MDPWNLFFNALFPVSALAILGFALWALFKENNRS